jgi:hypothetical protein
VGQDKVIVLVRGQHPGSPQYQPARMKYPSRFFCVPGTVRMREMKTPPHFLPVTP